ncbi:phosphoserine phosphatase SerB [Helicobacter sp. 23-1044]
MKLAVFDFDSTLMDGETIDELAKAHGVSEKVAKITHLAMDGKLDFYESLKKRVAFLRGMSEQKARAVCENLPLMNGAVETIALLKERGYKIVCFSGGFSLATAHFREILRIDAEFSNILHAKDGVLSGEVGGEMMFGTSKGRMLCKVQNLLGISPENTLAVGDGANDIAMFQYARQKVAFCAKDALKREANIIISRKDLREILRYV